MSNRPKISIITACYNAEKTVEQTIQSVINQTYDNIEYIIIDGYSTDRTMDIVEKYREKVDVIISEPDRGVYDAFNKGVSLATGDFINFMNADDFFSNNESIENVIKLGDFSNSKIVYGRVRAISEVTGEWHYRGKMLVSEDFKYGEMCPHQAVFVANELFSEFGGFDLHYKMLADVDFMIKCFKNYENNSFFLELDVANFRLGGLSSSLKFQDLFHIENKNIHQAHFNFVPQYTERYFNERDLYISFNYYKKWLETKILHGKLNLEILKNRMQKTAIFGTKSLGVLMYHDLKGNDHTITCFVENNIDMQGKEMLEVPIVSVDNIPKVDTIIICVERYEVAEEIKILLQDKHKLSSVMTWYDVIEMIMD